MKYECFAVLLLPNNMAGLKGNKKEPQVIKSLLNLLWTRYEPILCCLSYKMLWKRAFKKLKYQRVPLATLQMLLILLAGVCVKHKRCSKKSFVGASKKTACA